MDGEEVGKIILEIRQKLMLRMNGAAAAAMRDHGIVYKLNYGVTVPEIKSIASQYPRDCKLAQQLWCQECRECRMLAAMLYPASVFLSDMADVWIDSIEYSDLADVCCKYLFQYMPQASVTAFRWIACDEPIRQYCGFMIMAHLLRAGNVLRDTYLCELRDQATAAMASDLVLPRQAAAVVSGIIDD